MPQTFTITAITEDSPGVLHRITDLFTRRKLNIESLSVSGTEKEGVSRFTIVVNSEKDLVEKIIKQIRRVIEVLDAYVCRNSHLIFKEVALIKVEVTEPEERSKIEEVTARNDGIVISGTDDSIIIEKTGSDEEINALYLLLEPFGIIEFIRSGRVALLKKKRVLNEKYLD